MKVYPVRLVAVVLAVALVWWALRAPAGGVVEPLGTPPGEPTRLELTPGELRDALGSSWVVSTLNGATLGTVQVTLTRTPAGGFVFETETRVGVRIGDKSTRSTVREVLEFDPDPPHRLARGTRSGDDIPTRVLHPRSGELASARDGFSHTRAGAPTDFTLADALGPDAWLARPGRAPGDRLTCRELHLETGTVGNSVVEVTGVEPGTPDRVKYRTSGWRGLVTDGEVQGRRLLAADTGGVLSRQVDAAPAWGDGPVLTVSLKADRPVGDVGRVTRTRLLARGPLARELGTGPGQTVEHRPDGTAVLTADRTGPRVRATPAEQAEALADTFEYPHRLPAVAALVRQAVGDDRGSRARTAAKLLEFVGRHLTPDPRADPKTFPALLRDRRGVCRHYAALFVTLCRAAGVPARGVTGLASNGGAEFGAHAWAEVVLDDGCWAAYDPTFGQAHAASHVRLHADDRDDAKLLRVRDLELRVEAVSARPVWPVRVLAWVAGLAGLVLVARLCVRFDR